MPSRLVTPDDVRPMLGEIGNVSKGIVTTTSSFDPTISTSEEFQHLLSLQRIELRDGETIAEWVRELRETGRLSGFGHMNPEKARDYFEMYVRPALAEWEDNPDDLRRVARTGEQHQQLH
jgi:hypothetical protein